MSTFQRVIRVEFIKVMSAQGRGGWAMLPGEAHVRWECWPRLSKIIEVI